MSSNGHAFCLGQVFGRAHKFRPRYEEVVIDDLLKHASAVEYTRGQTLAEQFTRSVYVRDVCVRCGATVERVAR